MTILNERLIPNLIEDSFQSIEQYSHAIAGLDLDGYQLSRGDFNGVTQLVSAESFTLSLRAAKSRHIQIGHVDAEHVAMIYPLKDLDYIVNGRRYGHNQQIITYSNSESKILFPEDHEHFTLLINTSNLNNFFEQNENEIFLDSCKNFASNKIATNKKSEITRNITEIFKTFKYLLDHPCSLLAYKDSYDTLFYAIKEYYISDDQTQLLKTQNRERLLARALEYIHNSDLKNLSVSELIKETHASSRSIQYCFSKLLGTTPKKYLVKVRLNAIRKDLLLADPKQETITSIAQQYGVINIGRFKQDYQRFFNEAPLQTLNRNILKHPY